MSEADRVTVRRVPLEAINEGRIEVVDEVLADGYDDHMPLPPGFPEGREGLKSYLAALRSAFPDIRYTLVHEIAEGDMVVQHVTASGTMRGDIAGMKATGRHATWDEIHIARMRGGKVVEHWGVGDNLAMAQQLGLIPGTAEAQAA